MSALRIEQPGQWRGAIILPSLLLAFSPSIAAVFSLALQSPASLTNTFDPSFLAAMSRSAAVVVSVCCVGILIGLPAGILTALYSIPGKFPYLALIALPLLVPSFLWAIGLSMLRIALGMPHDSLFSGFSGTTIVFSASAVPLVALACLAASQRISQSEIDAARMAGGEWRAVFSLSRSVFPMALAAGMLGGILTLSDPGPGQILGFDGAASHVLVSFAAQYDFALATQQSLVMAAGVLFLSLPLAVWLAPQLSNALLVRQSKPLRPTQSKVGQSAGFVALTIIFILGTLLPLSGLLHPLMGDHPLPLQPSWQVVERTAGESLYLATLAGILGATMGVILALCAGRERLWRTVLLGASLLIFAMPPALTSMGVMFLAAHCPPYLDFLTRSHTTVGIVEALRFFPIGVVLAMRSFGCTSPEWSQAAAIHGMSLCKYLTRIIAPWMFPSFVIAAFLIALLSTADVTTALLLSPPGSSTLPLAIFTVMANAPEALVATLCLLYVGGTILLVFCISLAGKLLIRSSRSNRLRIRKHEPA